MKKIFAIVMAVVIMFGVSELKAQKQMSNPQTIGGQLGLIIPTGNLGDIVGMGVGVNAQYTYYTSPKFAVVGTLGYHSYLAKEIEVGGMKQGIEYSASVVALSAGAFYQVGKWGKLLPIVGGELGYHMGSLSHNGTDYGSVSYDIDNDIVISLLGGVLYPINRSLAMRSDLKYALSNNYGGFSLNVGLMYKL